MQLMLFRLSHFGTKSRLQHRHTNGLIAIMKLRPASRRCYGRIPGSRPFLRVPALCFCGVALAAASLQAAHRIEGTTTYEVFSRSGKRNLEVREQFTAWVEGKRWFIVTRLLSTDPPTSRPQMFCPPSQEMGSDGGDAFYLKDLAQTNSTLVGWVEPGNIPNMRQSPTACVIWLGFVSGFHFLDTGVSELKPLWAVQANKNRQNRCEMAVRIHRNAQNPDYLDSLIYLADGRVDPCDPSTAPDNIRAEPWSTGFTQAVYRLANTIDLGNAQGIPVDFSFELYSPVVGASPPRLDVFARVRAVVTNVEVGVSVTDWLPPLPGDKPVIVDDYRFSERVTNWTSVAYAVSNQWHSRTSSVLTAAVRAHETTKSVARPSDSNARTPIIRFLVWLTLLLPLAVVVWRSMRDKNNKKEQA
jgi:hypothetical protein